MQTDVAIVGAGPAGSVVAQRLATAGIQVTLVEQQTFPRDKPCGDGVTSRGLAVLERLGLGDWAAQFHQPGAVRVRAPDGQVVDGRPDVGDTHCYGRIIPRRLLDARLVQAAVQAGARLVEGQRVRRVEWTTGSKPSIVADGLKVSAELVILADGSHAPITRKLGLTSSPPEMVAVRQYLSGEAGPEERMEFHFERPILPQYNWLFPLGDGRVNVGTIAYTQRARRGRVNLQEVLACFIADPTATERRLARAEPVGPVQGHPLHTGLGDTRTHTERVLVVGDAAGLVNPLSGEGIAPALESGELAAAHARTALEAGEFSARVLASYSQALKACYGAEHRAARLVRLALSTPRLLNHMFRRLRQDRELAYLIGYVVIGHKSPRVVLRPTTLLRLLT